MSVFNPQARILQALEPVPTSTNLKDESRNSTEENKENEEHFYLIIHHPSMVIFPV